MNHLSERLFIHVFQPFRARSIVYNCTDGYFLFFCFLNQRVSSECASYPTVGNSRKNASKLHVFMRGDFFFSPFEEKKKEKETKQKGPQKKN